MNRDKQHEALRLAACLERDRVDEIERQVSCGQVSAKQCFAKMRELLNAQPVVPTPLSATEVSGLLELAGYWPGDSSSADFINGIRYAEMEHGITPEKQG